MDSFVSSERKSDDFLCINSCDCQRFFGIDAGSRRPKGRIDYQLIYIAKGVCYVTIDGNETAVKENSVILYPPRCPQIYCFKADTDSVSYYVHFCGTMCEKILNDLKLDEKQIILFKEKTQIEKTFEKLVREFQLKRPFYEQNCQGILLSLFSIIARSAHNISDKGVHEKTIYNICTKMHENYMKNLSVSEYAKMIHLSADRFTHIFTQTMGISPKQYLLRIRIERATELLENTDLTVARISELVGFSDGNYFSRLFKKYTGHSPCFYR